MTEQPNDGTFGSDPTWKTVKLLDNELLGKALMIRLDDGSTYAQMAGRVVSIESHSGIPGVPMVTIKRDRDLDLRAEGM